MQTVALISPMMKALKQLIKIDPLYEQHAGDRILGRMYFKVPGILGGSNKKSLKHAKVSITQEPGKSYYGSHRFIADFYLDHSKYKEAFAHYTKAQELTKGKENEIEVKRELEFINKGLKRARKKM